MADCRSMSRTFGSARLWIVAVFAIGLSLGQASVWAQQAPSNTRAARLTFLQGSVTVDSSDNTGSQPAQLNMPLLSGIRLATGYDGQAEVEFEDGSLVRLTPNTALSLDSLAVEAGGDGGVFTTAVSLLHGLAYAELRATAQYRYALDAGGDVLSPVENTTVRVNFDQPPASFAVLDGTARVERQIGQNSSQREVRAGETLQGNPANPAAYSLNEEIAQDSWDDWNQERDQAAVSEASSRTAARDNYAGSQGYGWSDLDANGSWYDVPGQGQVWQPQVAFANAGFDPYGNGSWVFANGGYVWASGYSWGWTPYRCGNWSFYGGFGWGWSPVGSCSTYGYGFWGADRPVNILRPPGGYQVPHVPRPRPGPVHPVLPTRISSNPDWSSGAGGAFARGPRRINGVTVAPLETVGSGFTGRPGESIHSSLQRDFPIDRTTHTAVFGRPATQPGVVRTDSGWRSTARPGGNAITPSSTPIPVYRVPIAPGQQVQRQQPNQPGQQVQQQRQADQAKPRQDGQPASPYNRMQNLRQQPEQIQPAPTLQPNQQPATRPSSQMQQPRQQDQFQLPRPPTQTQQQRSAEPTQQPRQEHQPPRQDAQPRFVPSSPPPQRIAPPPPPAPRAAPAPAPAAVPAPARPHR